MKMRLFITLLAVLALGLVACSDNSTPEPEEVATEVAEVQEALSLALTSWQLESFGEDDAVLPAIDEAPASVNFLVSRYFGYTGCNWILGSYEVSADTISIFSPSQTNITCDEAIQTQEATFISSLTNITSYAVSDGKLIGYTTDEQQLITMTSLETQALDTTNWNLMLSIQDDGAAIPVLDDTAITAQFTDGTITGETGCGTYSATFEIGENTSNSDEVLVAPVTVSDVTVESEGECSEPEGAQDQQDRFIAILESIDTINHAGNTVLMGGAENANALAFGAGGAAE